MTIKEAVEFYNQQKEEIRILKKVKENVMRFNSQEIKDPFGDIHMSKEEASILFDVLDKHVYALEESLNKEFNTEEPQEGR